MQLGLLPEEVVVALLALFLVLVDGHPVDPLKLLLSGQEAPQFD